ncbi:tetratricopeptide repeat protein [Paraburkholderia sp. J67]|uniref:tetratricopeptide repeat protein n=1 Tax=Paraburkholderia sp. J67 TaxID=2805435 RepID=UPI002ABE30F5|nr:tetratricopeptide repeat protein [Paraburkholderia sp. J67]
MRLVFTRFMIGLCAVLVVMQSALADSPIHQLITAMSSSDLPRYTKLPLFAPHRKDFICAYQDQHLPSVDPQANLWFQQALALELDPNTYWKDKDWRKIYQLYQQAAERNHWKAMLNLASLILGQYPVPEKQPEMAIRWVEKAMQLGVPDAWDTMGVYHMKGIVKGGDATSAYAFFQKAADMGSPSAQAFLGAALNAGWDNPSSGFWANMPVATKMLECSLAQGYGDAADELEFIYAADKTPEAKLRAVKVLQDGVKLGSAKCASLLSSQFDGLDMTNGDSLVGNIDKARADRYGKISDVLEWYQGTLKLPNLDKVLPLPPAPLPKWDGDVETLIDAAKAVTSPVKSPASAPHPDPRSALIKSGLLRSLSDGPHPLRCDGGRKCPQSGIWAAQVAVTHPLAALYNRWDRQAFVEKGASFPDPRQQHLDISVHDVRWTWLGSPNRIRVADVYEIAL